MSLQSHHNTSGGSVSSNADHSELQGHDEARAAHPIVEVIYGIFM